MPIHTCHGSAPTTDCLFVAGAGTVHTAVSAPRPVPPAEGKMVPDVVASRDLAGLGWWLVEQIASESMAPNRGAIIASAIRVRATLPEPELPRDEALAEIELMGRLMNGLPPRDEEQWARARAMYEPEAIEEFERWARLYEGDALDELEPLAFGDAGTEQG